jgi:RimJ/RimL family protein N-acetyltransferase
MLFVSIATTCSDGLKPKRLSAVKAPERIETTRLILRRPRLADAQAIFTRYATDPEVTRYVAWPRHVSIAETQEFLEFSEAGWTSSPSGAYLVESRSDGTLLGSTGLHFEAPERASTGYVLAKDAWGKGYATESLQAMVSLAQSLNVRRLYALCHVDNHASAHVLEKCAFEREAMLPQHTFFPNLSTTNPCDVFIYAYPTR